MLRPVRWKSLLIDLCSPHAPTMLMQTLAHTSTVHCGCSHAHQHLFFSSEALISGITQLSTQLQQPTISLNALFFPTSLSLSFYPLLSITLFHPPSINLPLDTPALQIHSFVSLCRNHISHLFLDNRQSPSWLFHNTGCTPRIATAHIALQYFNLPSHVTPASVSSFDSIHFVFS